MARSKQKQLAMPKARLEEMVEEAIVDAYGESEQLTGLFTMIENDLELPFASQVLGVEATVVKIDLDDRGDIVAICKRCARGCKPSGSVTN